jgi:hypothetical protein
MGINDIHCDGNCIAHYRFQAIQSPANDCPKYLPQLACVTDVSAIAAQGLPHSSNTLSALCLFGDH